MEQTQFETAFYAAKGVYSINTGGGDLNGYDKVKGGFWLDETTR